LTALIAATAALGEELIDVLPEVLGQAFVDDIGFRRENGIFQGNLQPPAGNRQTVAADFACDIPVAQVEALAEQFGDAPRETHCAALGGFQDLVVAAEDMLVALLVPRLLETVIGRPAIVDQHTIVIETENVRRRFVAARRINDFDSAP
jgi:hypothetical protein